MGMFENTVLVAIAENELIDEFNRKSESYLNEIKDMFGPSVLTVDNPLSMKWLVGLNESLVKTYDVDAAKRHICKFFNLPENYFRIIKTGYNTVCLLQVPVKECSVDDIIKAMDWYGYFCSNKNNMHQFDDWAMLKFEAKFEKNANELLNDEKYLFHLSPSIYREKIEKIGFVPKHKNNLFDYPERIYFVFGSNSPVENIKLAKLLRSGRSADKEMYAAYRLPVEKIPSNVVFHVDPNLSGSVWTYDNIPPSAIEDVIEFQV